MPIYQTNVWICEHCGKIFSATEEVLAYSDPVVGHKEVSGWEYVEFVGKEKYCCTDCVKRHKVGQ